MTKPITVIMLGHKSLVGKDTLYSSVKNFGIARAAFADKLKSTVADLYGFSYEQMHGNLKDEMDDRYPNTVDKEYTQRGSGGDDIGGQPVSIIKNPDFKPYFTPRRILQIFGQQQRSLFPDIWASYVFYTEVDRLSKAGSNIIVVTDFRFKNEAKVAQRWAKETGNILHIVKINRPSVTALSGASDISENDLNTFEGWDYIIDNTGTLKEYEDKCVTIVSGILTK